MNKWTIKKVKSSSYTEEDKEDFNYMIGELEEEVRKIGNQYNYNTYFDSNKYQIYLQPNNMNNYISEIQVEYDEDDKSIEVLVILKEDKIKHQYYNGDLEILNNSISTALNIANSIENLV